MKQRNALALLLLTSFIWGLSFVAQSVSADNIGPFTFNGIRMLIGALVLLPMSYKRIRKAGAEERKGLVKVGLVCGILLATASMAQQYGVINSTAGKAGFITSLYIIIVPFLSVVLKKKVGKKIWVSALIALAGMYMLCMKEGFSLSKGDAYLVICAFLFALHIMAIDMLARDYDGVSVSMLQFLFSGILCSIGMIAFESPRPESIAAAWLPIIYAGVFSCGIAYTLQVIGQKYVQPTLATLALSLESVWAAVGGAVILSERMSVREAAGCLLVFSAVLLAQVPVESLFKKK